MQRAASLTLTNADVLDVDDDAVSVRPRQTIVIEDGVIRAVENSASGDGSRQGDVLDLGGRIVMPGLIDGHVHATAWNADLAGIAEGSPFYAGARAVHLLNGMLLRGFTTVRDVGGADYGLAQAVTEGYISGPRLFFGGKALSQTGGHGDVRPRGRQASIPRCCPSISVVVDGADEVRRAAREELRNGAHHIKIMLGGGVASPSDEIDDDQFSDDEIAAAVEAARGKGRYVAGHAYTSTAINRGLRAGVMSIEHGNLMDDSSLPLFRETGAYYVPTLAAYAAMKNASANVGLSPESLEKNLLVSEAGLSALDRANRGGVKIVFGTDLLGSLQDRQSTEFHIRREVQSAHEILRSATVVAAEMLGMAGRLGTISEGAFADMLVLGANPAEDIGLLAQPEKNLQMIVKGGAVQHSNLR